MSNKSRMVTVLLCGFLGGLGIHRFYVGKVGTGVAQLLCTLSFIAFPVSAVWAFIDLIMILLGTFKDKEGKLITNWN